MHFNSVMNMDTKLVIDLVTGVRGVTMDYFVNYCAVV